MKRESTGFVKTLGVYFTIAFAALQALDVLLDRLGLPERLFTQASVAVVLFLPAAVAIGLIRRLLAEEDGVGNGNGRATLVRARSTPSDEAPRAASGPPSSDVAAVHLRLARLHEKRGDDEGALRHYERYVELSDARRRTDDGPLG